MSIPPDSPWRGCAANFPQPVEEVDVLAAQCLVETVYYFNCRTGASPLPDIVYRSSSGEHDIVHHVFRWDSTPFEEIFENGFQVRRQEDTTDEVYYDLDRYVHHSGRPLDSRRTTTHAFVSTTLNSNWHPSLSPNTEVELFRYEIYAPGGIWVGTTFGDRYQHHGQDEVCFVAGIARQYIRSAQRFRLISDGRYTRAERVDHVITINRGVDSQSHPPRLLRIRRPVSYYVADGNWQRLTTEFWPPQIQTQREKRQVSMEDSAATTGDWYADKVGDSESFIDAAFRSSRTNEAYIFMNNEYVLLDYAPGTTDDRVVNGPLLICDGFPSLTGTAFAEHGIDSAFQWAWKEEAFIFSGNLCALVNFAPGTLDDSIKKGPMTITAMFPFFKGTVFESGVDAAFQSTTEPEAYLFKGNQYALINYDPNDSCRIAQRLITEGFPSLTDTIFESGIDAAFASHRGNEAYIFKGDSYALINFAPGTTGDYIIGGVKKILPNWPSLRTILPRKNRGLDVHVHRTEAGDRDHVHRTEAGDRDHDEL